MNRNRGTGPGEITPDGCAVEFYALLPSFGEPQIVHDAVPAGAEVLELGCGTGRILRPLAQLGHPVLGVDESPAMLARLRDLPTVCSPIETLRLDRTFGSWFENVEQAPRARDEPGGIRRIIRSARREPPRLHIEVEYQVGSRTWTHAWASNEIGAAELTGDLAPPPGSGSAAG